MSKGYLVVGPLAVAKVAGSEQYLRKGTLVPSDVPAEQVKHLLSVGLIAECGEQDTEISPPQIGEDSTVAELRAYAAEHGINLGDASRKDDILAAIRAFEG